MATQLTSTERQLAAIILIFVGIGGLAMAVAGRSDPLSVHGLFVMIFAGGLMYVVISSFYEPEPTEDRQASCQPALA